MKHLKFPELISSLGVVSVFIFLTFGRALGAESHTNFALEGSGFSHDIKRTLSELDYSEVRVGRCEVSFQRQLTAVCPTDKPIAFQRSLKLHHVNVAEGFEILLASPGPQMTFALIFRSSSSYSAEATRLLDFKTSIVEEFPGTGWPFRFDSQTPRIANLFWDEFRNFEYFSYWKFMSCFGESPFLDQQVIITGVSSEVLEELGHAITSLSEQNQCFQP